MVGLFSSKTPTRQATPARPSADEGAAEEARRKTLETVGRNARRSATLLTGGQGVTEAPPVRRASLLSGAA